MESLEFRIPDESLRRLLASESFRATGDPLDRYLAVLEWCVTRHPADFAYFVANQDSSRRYQMFDIAHIEAARAHNRTRRIDDSRFWAILNIDDDSRRDFVERLLDYIGCDTPTVAETCSALGFRPRRPAFRLPWVA